MHKCDQQYMAATRVEFYFKCALDGVYFVDSFLCLFVWHITFVGGGSALLPAPIPPITLQEKQEVARCLAAAGATIQELNTVRRALSLLKGGGLAHCAYPAQVRLCNCFHLSH